MNDTDNIELPPDILPEENQEEEKNLGGRPPKWTDPEVLQGLINEYFARCDEGYVKIKRDLLYDEHMVEWKEAVIKWQESCSSGSLAFKTEKEQQEAKPREPKKEWKVIEHDLPTITGLSLYLGCDIDTIKNYSTKDGFFRPIKEAYAKVQQSYEERLQGTTPTGAIFALKNFGWKDKTESDVTSGGQPMFGKITVTIDE